MSYIFEQNLQNNLLLRYKTELCRSFQENGTCRFADKCTFAHGLAELRAIPRHPRYKTEACRTYHSLGYCQYGIRCHFIHGAQEQMVNLKSVVGQFAGLYDDNPFSKNNGVTVREGEKTLEMVNGQFIFTNYADKNFTFMGNGFKKPLTNLDGLLNARAITDATPINNGLQKEPAKCNGLQNVTPTITNDFQNLTDSANGYQFLNSRNNGFLNSKSNGFQNVMHLSLTNGNELQTVAAQNFEKELTKVVKKPRLLTMEPSENEKIIENLKSLLAVQNPNYYWPNPFFQVPLTPDMPTSGLVTRPLRPTTALYN